MPGSAVVEKRRVCKLRCADLISRAGGANDETVFPPMIERRAALA